MSFFNIYFFLILILLFPKQITMFLVNTRILRGQKAVIFYKTSKYISDTLSLINTLIHELGHTIMTILSLNKPQNIVLNSDSSGFAVSSYTKYKPIRLTLTALAGYTASSIFTIFYFILLSTISYKSILVGLIILIAFSLITLIRNVYGFIWGIVFGGLLYVVAIYGNNDWQTIIAFCIGYVFFISSFLSTITLMQVVRNNPAESSDALTLKKLTGIPELFWCIFFIVFAIFCDYLAICYFTKSEINSIVDIPNYFIIFIKNLWIFN